MLPVKKYKKAKIDFTKPHKVQGNCFFFVLFVIKILNKKGINTWEINTTHRIPVMEIKAIDFSAGCFAKIRTPKPAIVVIAERKMEDLNDERFFLPV